MLRLTETKRHSAETPKHRYLLVKAKYTKH